MKNKIKGLMFSLVTIIILVFLCVGYIYDWTISLYMIFLVLLLLFYAVACFMILFYLYQRFGKKILKKMKRGNMK